MLVLFADSDMDITPEIASEYGAHLISMPYGVESKVIHPYEDFEKFDYRTYYNELRDGLIPSTSALNPDDYKRYFEPVFQNGDDILYVHFSSAMTGTFDFMLVALRELLAKYPERQFYSIDTKTISVGGLAVFREIGDMYRRGCSIDEIMHWADAEIQHFAVYFYADDLKFFKRSGRVKGITATMGQLMGVRPIIVVDEAGVMRNIGKEFGKAKAVNRLAQYVAELGDDVKNHRVVIGHTDCEESAIALGNILKESYGSDMDIEYVIVNPTAGAHCGPNCVGICFHAKHREGALE